MMPRRLNMRAEPVEPCPTCPEGWRPIGTEHCTDCYEGKIERLTAALKLARGAIEDCHRYRSHIHFEELAEIDRVLDWSRQPLSRDAVGALQQRGADVDK